MQSTSSKKDFCNVYDLQVEGDVSYVVENIAVKNCVIALALANKATQISGVPFAVGNFKGSNNNPYEDLVVRAKGESDLVKMIRMGIIK